MNKHFEWNSLSPIADGVYLFKVDQWDEDSDAITYHVHNKRIYDKDDKEIISYGGMWKWIGELPN